MKELSPQKTPDSCPKCGCVNQHFDIIKHGFKSIRVKMPRVSNQRTFLDLRKQRYLCKHCSHTFTVSTSIVKDNHSISNNTYHSCILNAKDKISIKDISRNHDISHERVNTWIGNLSSHFTIGSGTAPTMNFWTKEEFDKFISVVDDESAFVHFNVLFYTGIRIGELIAIRLRNIHFERGHIEILASAQFKGGKYIFTEPKTKKGKRIVTIQDFLTKLIYEYTQKYYTLHLDEQVFLTNKSRLAKELAKYAEIANVKRIRIHDLRHSHASLLIEQGIQPNIVQDRLGHENIETTLRTYSHLYPNKQYHLAAFINEIATNKPTVNSFSPNVNNPLQIETIK